MIAKRRTTAGSVLVCVAYAVPVSLVDRVVAFVTKMDGEKGKVGRIANPNTTLDRKGENVAENFPC
jgi:hypothetical protein